MELIATIFRRPLINPHGRTIHRQAVRAIILRGQALLMVYSPVNGDYKFPGGGVDGDEDHAAALRREVLEECGARLAKVGAEFGKVIEYDQPIEAGYDVFQMTSCYYLCEVEDELLSQRLDAYEADLQFQPVWVTVVEALRRNQALLQHNCGNIPDWTRREMSVLQQVHNRLLADCSIGEKA